MLSQLGILRMNVTRLDKPGNHDHNNADQSYSSDPCTVARAVFNSSHRNSLGNSIVIPE
jgi:hypothetical protein